MTLLGPGKAYTLVCTQLSLSQCSLDDASVGVLMDWCRDREICVQNLQLFKNKLTDDGAKHIANYLLFQQDKSNTWMAPCLAMRELHLSDNWIRSGGFYYLLSAVANTPSTYPIMANVTDDRATLEKKMEATKDKLEMYALWLRINNNYISPREVLFMPKESGIADQKVEGTYKHKLAGDKSEKRFLKTNINSVLDLKQPKVDGVGQKDVAAMFKPMEQTGDRKFDQETMTKKATAYNKSLEIAKCMNSACYLPYVRYQFKTDYKTQGGPEYDSGLYERVRSATDDSDDDSDDDSPVKGKGKKGKSSGGKGGDRESKGGEKKEKGKGKGDESPMKPRVPPTPEKEKKGKGKDSAAGKKDSYGTQQRTGGSTGTRGGSYASTYDRNSYEGYHSSSYKDSYYDNKDYYGKKNSSWNSSSEVQSNGYTAEENAKWWAQQAQEQWYSQSASATPEDPARASAASAATTSGWGALFAKEKSDAAAAAAKDKVSVGALLGQPAASASAKPPGLHTPGTTPQDEESNQQDGGSGAVPSTSSSANSVEVYKDIFRQNREALADYGSYYTLASREAAGDCPDWVAGACLMHNCCKYKKDEAKYNIKPAFPPSGSKYGGDAYKAGKYSDPAYIAAQQAKYEGMNNTLKRFYEGMETVSLTSEVNGEEWVDKEGGPKSSQVGYLFMMLPLWGTLSSVSSVEIIQDTDVVFVL